ncbi:hypothetical protein [Rhizobium phage RHph_X3_2]|nr:hypothetical protein [Rhizobium phage RHph_X3_2]
MNWKCNQRLRESGFDDPPEANAFKIGYAHGYGEIIGESTAAIRYPTSYQAGLRAGATDRAEYYAKKESAYHATSDDNHHHSCQANP